jgi:hypothetical protein
MISRFRAISGLAVGSVGLLCLAIVWAQQPSTNTAVTVVLRDGSIFKGTLEQKHIEIETAYGKFSVPIGDVRSIQFGVKPDAVQRARIDALIAELGNADFKTREKAQAELAQLGWLAAPQLEKALTSSDAEVVTRVKSLLADLDKLGDPPLRADEVDTKEFLIRGAVVATVFQVTTENGVLKIARRNLVSITALNPASELPPTRFEPLNIAGDWSGGCSVLQNKASVTFIYGSRERTIARFTDPTTIIYVSGAGSVNFPATVAPDARKINFNNGASWSR